MLNIKLLNVRLIYLQAGLAFLSFTVDLDLGILETGSLRLVEDGF